MSRKIMVVTAAYGADQVRQAGGQRAMLPVIAGAGADGVEIRRELFSHDELMALPALGESIELLGLLACYSAPAPLFMPDGTLNPDLPRYLSEASALNALWLKVSLGHFSDKQPLEALRALLDESGMTLVVENDQTDCGQLAPMQRFKAACRVMALPVTLTFDMGNWLWVGDSPEEAARQLAPAVSYIHVKAAVPHKARFRAVAPDQTDSRWRDLLNQLPADAPRGIEFPLEGTDLTAVTRHYVNLLREE
ncbi:sugar phosphate isomerase/epimerase family protein [Enterobacter hormaechei]|uniref:sugar phosphate isomerase/epimerase family protein n=1 Tax=Enterobacter hormaechei TaxID=158836 RepID=UPI001BAB42F0|nr:sugar phosphate isomerase/epimerase [Enterobacter hormaechei]ELD3315014.1 sugar phosphate isomerase/epimerase [Enterobacter hormaechei]ELD3471058.1 sugar phosphate isomerase/epimerase [Enterobacter hormaechei]ELD3485779.1 sugar phosphate isomerase/epimerase [Enterobacter hormaechei]MBS0811446.1 sugar phosphate isomerase/epimerase [Enterobacter hormaechei]MBS0817359.1 sugar phosphate isomerase/epimerase [Enterobacter hormaechei]